LFNQNVDQVLCHFQDFYAYDTGDRFSINHWNGTTTYTYQSEPPAVAGPFKTLFTGNHTGASGVETMVERPPPPPRVGHSLANNNWAHLESLFPGYPAKNSAYTPDAFFNTCPRASGDWPFAKYITIVEH